jgi:hypothetical protein
MGGPRRLNACCRSVRRVSDGVEPDVEFVSPTVRRLKKPNISDTKEAERTTQYALPNAAAPTQRSFP